MKALVIKTSALGDIIQTFPAIQFLYSAYPACEIDWVVEKRCASLIQAHPLVKQALVIDTKNWRTLPASIKQIRTTYYDVVFDFQGNSKSGIILALAKGDKKIGFGSKSVAEWPNLIFSHQKVDPTPDQNIRYDYLALIEAFLCKKNEKLENTLLNISEVEKSHLEQLKLKKGSQNWMICPGSQWFNKQLLPSSWITFLKKLNPPQLWLVYGTDQELDLCNAIKKDFPSSYISEKFSIPLLQHWMKEMDKIFAVDSMLLQLAAEAGVATYSFFGPSLASKYQPLGAIHCSVQGECPYQKTFSKRCPLLRTCNTGACLHDLKL